MPKNAKKPMKNSELFLLMEKLTYYMVAFIGVYILDPSYTLYTPQVFFSVFVVVMSHSICTIYTLFIYEQSSDMMLQTLATSGVGMIVSIRRKI